MTETAGRSFGEALAVYLRRPVLVLFLLGFSSGLPLALTTGTLGIWMAEEGVDLTTIGLFALVGLPYTLKFCWAPLVDRLPMPPLTRLLGRRRGWMVLTQLGLMAAIVALGESDPRIDPVLTAGAALAVAFLSASQDIVIDAYRVESLDADAQGAGAAVLVYGYRIGMLVSGAGALALAETLSWGTVYAIMAALILIGVTTILASPEPRIRGEEDGRAAAIGRAAVVAWLQRAVVAPFTEFMARPYWIHFLAFIVLFKLGDAFAGVMANPFYVQIGFTKTEIAAVSKVFGLAATLAGAFAGGVLVARIGLMRALLVTGLLQMLSNLMFVVQAWAGADVGLLTATIGLENLAGGMGTTAFVAYLSALCNRHYTATQYALLSSLMAVGRTVLAAEAGWVAEAVAWPTFFIVSTLVALPGIALLLWLMRHAPDPTFHPEAGDPEPVPAE